MSRAGNRVYAAMHAGFFVLMAAAASRLVIRHGANAETALILCVVVAVIYSVGIVFWDPLGERGRLVWLAVVLGAWLGLVFIAPSFAWCSIPLFFMGLRLLPPTVAVAIAALLTGAVIWAQVRLSDRFDPSLVFGPVAVMAVATVVFLELQRTRDELADAQRSAGVLEERERLAREIHDTLAQGLTSMGMLLQAAEREWDSDPATARDHVRQAADAAEGNLEEARRFVRGLAPADLAGGSLAEALRRMIEREAPGTVLRLDGDERPLAPEGEAVLLRVAQGALANAREHAGAGTIVVTLTWLDGAVTLDVADDGAGFDPSSPGPSAAGRGYGLRAMRDRLAAVDGTLVIESAPGEGTVVAARIGR
ncbi:sensor histidine kinase [Actinomadura barringtoniae]|nr:sensor histidine kinase [Actinomadura barringtoniae]